ncbi:Multidrug resistance-associated protein 4 [Orchesella cincta]|uniref:Multidrug resistance-associated protein 4 n=1 Tax=Orchesella cincta TaxID=48709 RepID=A0A1D2NHD3_ORCCI|nr:Multidrug resistance-associated protein 4 [Orchesella cincta]
MIDLTVTENSPNSVVSSVTPVGRNSFISHHLVAVNCEPYHHQQDTMDFHEIPLETSPEIKANPISKLFLLWLLPFLRKGAKNDLNAGNVYKALPEDCSSKLGTAVQAEWDKERKRAISENRQPKLWRVVRSIVWKKYLVVVIVCCFDELFLRENTDDPDVRKKQFLYAGALVACTLGHAIFFQKLITATMHMGMKMRLGISSVIYRKILKLRKADSEQTNVGKLVNFLSSDVSRLDQVFNLLHCFIIAPFQSEIKFVRRHLYLRGIYVSGMMIAWKVIPFAALILYVALGDTLTADAAFFSISVFNIILQAIMNRIPNAASQLGECLASLNRIELYLLSKENQSSNAVEFINNELLQNGKTKHQTENGVEQKACEPRILLNNYSASWTEPQQTLQNINVNLKGNKLVMVIGHVGAGKEGGIWSQGTYEELKNSEVDFASLIDEEYFNRNNEQNEMSDKGGLSEKALEKRRSSTTSDGKNDPKSENKRLLDGSPVLRKNDEQKDVGSVGIGTYFRYFKSGGSYIAIVLLLLGFALAQSLHNFIDYWLSLWTNSVAVSEDSVDEYLPLAFFDFVTMLLSLIGMIVINVAANYYTAVPSAILLFSLWKLRGFFLASARDLKRLEALGEIKLCEQASLRHATKSPMFTHVTMTVQGLTTVRALRAENRILDQFEKIQLQKVEVSE